MKDLIMEWYRDAKRIYVVLDNLNTHFKKSFFETFSTDEANQILKRVRFIYTPKHASWLNMAEIEINLLDHECLDRNIPSRNEIEREIGAWCSQSNQEKRKIFWSFTKYKANKKLSKYFVS